MSQSQTHTHIYKITLPYNGVSFSWIYFKIKSAWLTARLFLLGIILKKYSANRFNALSVWSYSKLPELKLTTYANSPSLSTATSKACFLQRDTNKIVSVSEGGNE